MRPAGVRLQDARRATFPRETGTRTSRRAHFTSHVSTACPRMRPANPFCPRDHNGTRQTRHAPAMLPRRRQRRLPAPPSSCGRANFRKRYEDLRARRSILRNYCKIRQNNHYFINKIVIISIVDDIQDENRKFFAKHDVKIRVKFLPLFPPSIGRMFSARIIRGFVASSSLRDIGRTRRTVADSLNLNCRNFCGTYARARVNYSQADIYQSRRLARSLRLRYRSSFHLLCSQVCTID